MDAAGAGARKRPRPADAAPAAAAPAAAAAAAPPPAGAGAGAAAAASAAVLAVLEAHPAGLTQRALMKAMPPGAHADGVMGALQALIDRSRVEVLAARAPYGQEATVVFRIVSAELASKLQGLSPDETAVLNLIDKTGANGLWVRNLKLSTKLPLTALNKILKKLEKAKLVKPVKSIAFKNRRMYMAFDTEPAKEVTGGIWYSEQTLDDDFIDSMREVIVFIMRVRASRRRRRACRAAGVAVRRRGL
jgi:DNA-binding MarR family transcriptional regulator